MLFEPVQITVGQITFNRLQRPNNYWAVGYDAEMNVILSASNDPLITVPTVDENRNIIGGWQEANSVTDAIWQGFGADTFQELWDEIKRRGVILPQDVLDYLSSIGFN